MLCFRACCRGQSVNYAWKQFDGYGHYTFCMVTYQPYLCTWRVKEKLPSKLCHTWHRTWSFLQQKIAWSQEEVAEVGTIQDFWSAQLEDPDISAWLGVFLVEPGFAVTDGFRLSGNQTLLGKRYWKKLGIQLPKYIVPELPLGFGYELDQNSMILLLFFTSGTTIYFWSSQTGHSLLLWSQILLQTILASSS
jgi:hypothetical protein